MDTRLLLRYFRRPILNRHKFKGQSGQYATVLQRWFQSRTGDQYDDRLNNINDFDYFDESETPMIQFLYSDEERKNSRFRPSRDGIDP